MTLPFLDRTEEMARLRSLLAGPGGSMGVLYGRRRCGKTRLIEEVLQAFPAVYYVGDDREGPLQRTSLATEISRQVPGFDRVEYPGWDALFELWWKQAPAGSVLALDEFPSLVSSSREIPSVLQKRLDAGRASGPHLLLAGSSQRMMQGLVLDRTAPLFGRAREIMKIGPLPAGLIQPALKIRGAAASIEAYAVWGGIPRYWELATEHASLREAIRSLVLSPLGVLHEEPRGQLLDDLRETAQARSILSLVGAGCHRVSEIAGRMGKPSTALSRAMQRLLEMGLVTREVPFGCTEKNTKRTLYRISDPFLRFWFRYVEPNRSRLEARQIEAVEVEIARSFAHHAGGVWEELARQCVARTDCFGQRWKPASRWWGAGLDRRPMEIDIVAENEDGDAILLGEVRWTDGAEAAATLHRLRDKARRFPHVQGRQVHLCLWLKRPPATLPGAQVYGPAATLENLR